MPANAHLLDLWDVRLIHCVWLFILLAREIGVKFVGSNLHSSFKLNKVDHFKVVLEPERLWDLLALSMTELHHLLHLILLGIGAEEPWSLDK